VLSQGVVGHVAPYAAAKGGLWQITRSMALELARHQVRVNALAPGYIETEINRDFVASTAGERMRQRVPQRRFGATSDLDGALLLLASDASRYMTGSIVVVDGGFLLT
jgi:3-oxoacyl-[acyl-carrier protein] reductase